MLSGPCLPAQRDALVIVRIAQAKRLGASRKELLGQIANMETAKGKRFAREILKGKGNRAVSIARWVKAT